MKNGSVHTKTRQQPARRDQRIGQGVLGLPLWVWLAFVVIVTAGGTLAAFELIIWNKVPPELVGTWDVECGPLLGGTFDFSRNGKLQMRFKQQGKEISLTASVAVKGRTLLTTTHEPLTGKEETNKSIIRELTARTLIIELDSGDVLKLGR